MFAIWRARSEALIARGFHSVSSAYLSFVRCGTNLRRGFSCSISSKHLEGRSLEKAFVFQFAPDVIIFYS